MKRITFLTVAGVWIDFAIFAMTLLSHFLISSSWAAEPQDKVWWWSKSDNVFVKVHGAHIVKQYDTYMHQGRTDMKEMCFWSYNLRTEREMDLETAGNTWKQLMATNSFWVEVTKKRKNKLVILLPMSFIYFFGLLEQTVKREGDKAEHQVSVSCAVINTAASKNNTERKKSPWNHAHFVLCVF